MNNTKQDKPDWATALEHHEEMCVERGRTIAERFNSVSERFNSVDAKFNSVDVRFNAVDVRFDSIEKRLDNIEKLQRFTLGAILAWPPLLIAVMKLLP